MLFEEIMQGLDETDEFYSRKKVEETSVSSQRTIHLLVSRELNLYIELTRIARGLNLLTPDQSFKILIATQKIYEGMVN